MTEALAASPSATVVEENAPEKTPAERLEELWPAIRKDAEALRDIANPITPTDRVLQLWATNIQGMPAIRIGTAAQTLLARLPATVDHLLLVPWLGISGGSEKVTQRLVSFLCEQYEYGQVAILAPDAQFDLSPARRLQYDLPIVAFNDVDRQFRYEERVELLDIMLTQLQPRTAHIINSDIAWHLLRARLGQFCPGTHVFANIYSDIRLRDGAPAGYFWRYLPDVIPYLAGVIADNATVIARAASNFSLLPEQLARFHVVPTPVVGSTRGAELGTCRLFMPGAPRHTLWMSRIAHEKRLDVVKAIAQELPERMFSVYGALIPGSVPHDFLDWTRATANVRHEGSFSSFEALPLHTFDSYLFTTSAEGMPLSLLEATMLGLPTVAPAVGGIGEFIDETTGWLIPRPDDVAGFAAALEDIAARPAEAGRRVAAAQRRLVERHSWSAFVQIVSAIPDYLVRRRERS